MIKDCIFPVAGLGTRFLPATKEIPKEMVPLLDKPVIQYGVEEAVNSGFFHMVMVTGRSKKSIEDFFDRSWELERMLKAKGKDELLSQVQAVSSIADVSYTRQSEPLGLGHAVLCGESLCSGDYIGVILPDDVIMGDQPVLGQLKDVHDKYGGSVLALEEVPMDQVSRYGVVDADLIEDGVFSVKDIVEKPSVEESPSNLAVMGRYILSRKIFQLLKEIPRGVGGEYQLTDAIKELIKSEPIRAVIYRGDRYDCGTLKGWLSSTVKLACRRPDLVDIVKEAVGGL